MDDKHKGCKRSLTTGKQQQQQEWLSHVKLVNLEQFFNIQMDVSPLKICKILFYKQVG